MSGHDIMTVILAVLVVTHRLIAYALFRLIQRRDRISDEEMARFEATGSFD